MVSFFPCLILAIISFNNSTFTKPTIKQLGDLDIESYLLKEKNIQKAIAVSNTLKRTLPYFSSDPKQALALYLHSKNELKDSYREEDKIQDILDEILFSIWSAPNPYLPSQIINYEDSMLSHSVFISQLLVGIVAYLLFKTRSSIRNFILGLIISSVILSVAGIIQKIQYIPSEYLKEIWGIWDTPEPRYFYASFTYKNHWSAFVLLMISSAIGLLFHGIYSKNLASHLNRWSIINSVGLIALIITIPHSGSRSGVLVLLVFSTLAMYSIGFKKIITNFKKNTYKITLAFIVVLLGGFSISNSTTREMITTTSSQINSNETPLRILLWNDLVHQISCKTFWGYGYDSYGAINPLFQSPEIRIMRKKVLEYAHNPYVPLVGHGHSDMLEYISEFGWMGFSFFILPIFLLLLRNFLFCPSLLIQSISAGCLCFVLYCCIDFPTRTPACLILFSVLVGLSFKYTKLSFSN
tara:strand:- start:1192 stop:2592 length:1401 start_codon:yes stop_codon:yes gene_type:complete